MASPGNGEDAPRERPRLKLKPRDEAAAQRASEDRAASAKSNPFGAAKPREAVLATRVGKKEEDILKEEVLKEKLALRLTPDQLESKRALEAAVQEVKDELEVEEDASKKDALNVELKEREGKLDGLMESFEKLALEKARSGEIGIRPSERRRQAEEAQMAAGGFPARADAFGAPQGRGNYGGGGRGFAGRGGYDYGTGGRGGRGGGFGNGSQGYGSSYRESGDGGYGGGGGYAEAPAYGGGEAYGSPGTGGGMRGARNGGGGGGGRGSTAGGLYDRFGGGYSANGYSGGAAPGAFAADGAGEVEYHSPYARQDRY